MQRRGVQLGLFIAVLVLAIVFALFQPKTDVIDSDVQQLPAYSGRPFIVIGDDIPSFTDQEKKTMAYEFYSDLDIYNRCGYAMACVGTELMPTEERGSIGQVRPTGWQTVKYDFVDGKYLYNRCHLIAYQLTGENANSQNLITGTRYMNIEGMLPFENIVADYVKETGKHVLYRVTPDFRGSELLARGVRLEGWSVEDNGIGVCFDVYAYNVQPGVEIDYSTGNSHESEMLAESQVMFIVYLLNTSSKRFHDENCGQGKSMKEENKEIYTGSREEVLELGYIPATCCDP